MVGGSSDAIFALHLPCRAAVAQLFVRQPHSTANTKPIMKTSEILKMLEQMHRDKRPTEEIYAATMRYREFAEAEEAELSQRKAPDFSVGSEPRIPGRM